MVYLKKGRAKTKRFTDRFPTIVENLCRQTQYAACIAACVRERVYVCAEGEGEKLYKSKQGKKKKKKNPTGPFSYRTNQIQFLLQHIRKHSDVFISLLIWTRLLISPTE